MENMWWKMSENMWWKVSENMWWKVGGKCVITWDVCDSVWKVEDSRV